MPMICETIKTISFDSKKFRKKSINTPQKTFLDIISFFQPYNNAKNRKNPRQIRGDFV